MNWRSIRAIALKDLMEVRQNKAAWVPALVLPIIFAIAFPVLFSLLPQLITGSPNSSDLQELVAMIDRLPPAMTAVFAGLDYDQIGIVYFLGFMLAPFYLIMPLMVSTIVGAESFVGEKERKTMEALLYTPTSDTELYLGKTLAAVIPAILLAWFTYLLLAIVTNIASYPVMGRSWVPLPAWYPMMFWLTPAFAVLGISATVLISSRVKTFMEAYQLSGSLVVVVLALVVGQISGILYLGVGATLLVGTLIWIVDVVLIWLGIRMFRRSRLIAKLD